MSRWPCLQFVDGCISEHLGSGFNPAHLVRATRSAPIYKYGSPTYCFALYQALQITVSWKRESEFQIVTDTLLHAKGEQAGQYYDGKIFCLCAGDNVREGNPL